MEFEFDKEMDALLRQATRSGETTSNTDFDSHLDADEISIFAENALPEKAKARVTKHLADCDRCRIILSNTITLNSEAAGEAVQTAVSSTENEVASVAGVPWYKKFFAMPGLAYGMGALTLVFAGMLGFLVVQNGFNSESQVAKQTSTRDSAANTFSEDLAEATPELTNSNIATDSKDADMSAPSELADGDVPNGPQTADDIGVVSDAKKGGERQAKNDSDLKGKIESREENELKKRSDMPVQEERDRLNRNKRKVEKSDEGYSDVLTKSPPPPPPAPGKTVRLPKVARKPAPSPKPRKTPRPRNSDDEITVGASRSRAKEKKKRPTDLVIETEQADKSSYSNANRKRINGKTFNRRKGVWYDSQYRGQKTTKVRKSSSAYRKLDSGLRTTVSKLGGTVVIVWKSKAYRIQ